MKKELIFYVVVTPMKMRWTGKILFDKSEKDSFDAFHSKELLSGAYIYQQNRNQFFCH